MEKDFILYGTRLWIPPIQPGGSFGKSKEGCTEPVAVYKYYTAIEHLFDFLNIPDMKIVYGCLQIATDGKTLSLILYGALFEKVESINITFPRINSFSPELQSRIIQRLSEIFSNTLKTVIKKNNPNLRKTDPLYDDSDTVRLIYYYDFEYMEKFGVNFYITKEAPLKLIQPNKKDIEYFVSAQCYTLTLFVPLFEKDPDILKETPPKILDLYFSRLRQDRTACEEGLREIKNLENCLGEDLRLIYEMQR